MADKPTIFLVDDNQSVRDAIEWLLESVDLHVEPFASAREFLDSFDAARPGCLVLDIRMPGMSGLELQDKLAAKNVRLPTILITGHGDVPMCVRAFEGGAFAFLEKPLNHQLLLDHVHRAIEEDRRNREAVAAPPDVASRFEQLTTREQEVMDRLVAGKSMKQIAAELDISVQTCSKHRAKVLEKMQVDNDVELVRLVLACQSITR